MPYFVAIGFIVELLQCDGKFMIVTTTPLVSFVPKSYKDRFLGLVLNSNNNHAPFQS